MNHMTARQISSLIAISTAMIVLSGCASALKKQCEKTNWFNYGKSVAMQGKRLDEVDFPRQCEKEEVPVSHSQLDLGFKSGMSNYCKPKAAYEKGREGVGFNLDMCESKRKLKSAHKKGVKDFCTKDGRKAGASGYIYKNICAGKLESNFLVQYRKGRRIYLKRQVRQKNNDIRAKDSEIADLKDQMSDVQTQMAMLPRATTLVRERRRDPVTGTWRDETRMEEDDNVKNKKSNLQYDMNRLKKQVSEKRREQNALRQEISRLETEIDSLEE